MTSLPADGGVTDPRRRGRTRWLVVGGALAVIIVVLFVVAIALQPTIAIVAIVGTGVLYAAMVIVAFTVRTPRPRNLALAWLMIAVAVLGLVSAVALYYAQAGSG